MPEHEAREVEHFLCCSDCRGYFDIRDLAQVIEHAGLLVAQRAARTSR